MTSFPDLSAPEQCEHPRSRYAIDCVGAHVRVHAHRLAVILSFGGEIDAHNADQVAQAVRRFSQLKTPLIVDLDYLDFLAVAGFRALLNLNEEHRSAHVHWSVVSGAAMRRLACVFADHGLPIVESVPEALRLIEERIWSRRQFVAGRQRGPQRNTLSPEAC